MNKKLYVYLAAMGTVVLWAISYIWIGKLIHHNIPPEFFVPLRILLAGSLLFFFNLLMGEDMRIKKGDAKKFLLLAFCMPFVYFICETYGQLMTDSETITSLVIATNPVFSVAAGLLIFKERFDWVNILGVAVTIAGLFLVTYAHETAKGLMFYLGILVLFVAVISEVSQISVTKMLGSGYSASVIVMYQFFFGTVLLLPLFFTKGIADFDASVYLSWEVIYPILALAVLCSATAFTLWAFAIKNLGVAKTSIFLAIVPLVTGLLSYLFGSETLGPVQWIGLAVAMVGLLLTQRVARNNKVSAS